MNHQAIAEARANFTGTDAEFLAAQNETVDVLLPRRAITLTSIRGAIGATYSGMVFGQLKQSDPYGYDCLIAGIDSDAPETLAKLDAIQQMLPAQEAAALKALCYSSRRASGESVDITQADLDTARRLGDIRTLRLAAINKYNEWMAACDALEANADAIPQNIYGL